MSIYINFFKTITAGIFRLDMLIEAMSITRIEVKAARLSAYGYMIPFLCE